VGCEIAAPVNLEPVLVSSVRHSYIPAKAALSAVAPDRAVDHSAILLGGKWERNDSRAQAHAGRKGIVSTISCFSFLTMTRLVRHSRSPFQLETPSQCDTHGQGRQRRPPTMCHASQLPHVLTVGQSNCEIISGHAFDRPMNRVWSEIWRRSATADCWLTSQVNHNSVSRLSVGSAKGSTTVRTAGYSRQKLLNRRRQLGIALRVLDRPVAEPILQRPAYHAPHSPGRSRRHAVRCEAGTLTDTLYSRLNRQHDGAAVLCLERCPRRLSRRPLVAV